VTDAKHLRRFDYSIAGGGPIWKDKIFFFGSAERITEDRKLDFKYPNLGTHAGALYVLQLLHSQEDPLDIPQKTRATRNFFKLNEHFGERHQLVQEINYTNEFVRGSEADCRQPEPVQAAASCCLDWAIRCCLATWVILDRNGPRLFSRRAL
jgi:hypothetical protein